MVEDPGIFFSEGGAGGGGVRIDCLTEGVQPHHKIDLLKMGDPHCVCLGNYAQRSLFFLQCLNFYNLHVHALIIIIGIACAESPTDVPTDAPTTTEEPEVTSDSSIARLQGWLAASIVIIIVVITIAVAFAVLSLFLYMKYRKSQKEKGVAPGPSATYEPAATGSPPAADPLEVKVNA